MRKLYGENALFIFDPKNSTNRPVPGLHDNALVFWAIYPQFFKDTFTTAFTVGLHDPLARIRENQWRNVFSKLRDSIYKCSNCNAENFYDLDYLKRTRGVPSACWSCREKLKLPLRIRIDKEHLVMLNYDTKLYPHHLNPQRRYDFTKPSAEINVGPSMMMELKNASDQRWVTYDLDGTVRVIEPMQSVNLDKGVKINFGHSEGEIRI